MNARTPFRLFSWHKPFLPALKNYLDLVSDRNPGSVILITPNKRPARYLLDLYAGDKKERLTPKVYAINELVAIWRRNAAGAARATLGALDQIPLLRSILLELAKSDENLAASLASASLEEFLPWGIRLSALLDELFQHGLTGKDIVHAEVTGFAAALLSVLGKTAEKFRAVLAKNNWTTAGYDYFLAATNANVIPPGFTPSENRRVVIAGFYALNGAENAILKSLWEAGAHVCYHTDPRLAEKGEADWVVAEHGAVIRKWKAKTVLWNDPTPPIRPEFKFFAAYDTHSQLEELARNLENSGDESRAIILSDADVLPAALHHLPQKDVNISMGYPLDRTPLSSLVKDILTARAQKLESGEYYWKDLLKIIRQPFLAALEDKDGESLRAGFHVLDKEISKGEKFVNPDDLLNTPELDADEAAGLKEILELCLRAFAEANTLRKTGQALLNLVDHLIKRGGDVWNRFPLDAEALSRLKYSLVPALLECELADEIFENPRVIGSLVESELNSQRVPFEADPLVGVQVMGLLETRLLNFDKIYILDATEDLLPGSSAQNPLLPDSLRPVLGLPDARSAQRVIAHYLFRLCACSGEANFFWEEGVAHSGLFDGKKTRSRYVESLVWEEEKKRGKLVKNGDEFLRTARLDLAPPKSEPESIANREAVATKVREILKRKISPTALDAYISCPYQFALSRILGVWPPQAVIEGEDTAVAGIIIHKTLEKVYENRLKKTVRKNDVTLEELTKTFSEISKDKAWGGPDLPAESRFLLEAAAVRAFAKYLDGAPEETFVESLEKTLAATITVNDIKVKLEGKLDRLDRRDGGLWLLDYKSGEIKAPDPDLWNDDQFFVKIRDALRKQQWDDESEDLYETLIDKMPSCQLPFYVTLLKYNYKESALGAAFVDLKKSGDEVGIFAEVSRENLARAAERCEDAIKLIMQRILLAPEFSTGESGSCSYCDYGSVCGA